jgi:uncharacterized protein (TIGR02246 family)
MNRRGIWILAVVLVAAGACAPKANDPKDIAAVKAQMAAYGQVASKGDAAALAELYADDAVRLSANTPMAMGKEAIRKELQTTFDTYVHRETDLAEDVQVVGDLAIARGVWTATETPKLPGGAVLDEKGKEIYVYRRQPGGSWKISAEIWNTDLHPIRILGPSTPDEFALLQLERDWMQAWLKQDAKSLDAILADSYMEYALGAPATKKQLLADMKAGVYKVDSAETSDMRAVVFGDHAVVNGIGIWKGTTRGKETNWRARWTDVYVKQDGRWRAVLAHSIELK